VRVDLDLSIDRLGVVVNQSERTLSRRQWVAIGRLTQVINRTMARQRWSERQRALRSCLPNSLSPQVFGREALLQLAWQLLTAAQGRRHVLLHGEKGSGKSTVALALAHRLIDNHMLGCVVWVCGLAETVDEVVDAVAAQVGLSGPVLDVFLRTVDTLVVVDDGTRLAQRPEVFADLLDRLRCTRLLVCADDPLWTSLDVPTIHIGDLDPTAAYQLLTNYVAQRCPTDLEWVKKEGMEWPQRLGGNPGTLLSAWRREIGVGHR
jgi:hypothetical protein